MRHTFGSQSSVSSRKQPFDLAKAPLLHSPDLKVAACSLPPLSGASSETFSVEDLFDDESQPPQSLKLSQAIPSAKFFGCSDMEWTEAADSKSISENQIAVYRIGEGDPNQLIADALAAGAAGILTEQLLPCPLPQCIVGDVDRALAEIASHQNERPDRNLLTIGVLGSNGKTSTCKLITTLTERAGLRTAFQSDLGISDGVLQDTSDQSVATGAALVQWLAEASDCMSRLAIIEIDDQAARKGHYDSVEFNVLVVTDQCQPSDDFGPCALQCLLDRLAEGGVVIVPEGDSRAEQILDSSEQARIGYGISSESEFAAISLDQSGGMSTLMLTAGETSAIMETPLCGNAMARNIAATVAMSSLLGISLHDVGQHLNTLRSIPGRGQRLVDFGRSTVVLETGGNTDRISSALRTARASGNGGRVWCVLAIGESDSEETLASYGGVLERFADHCIVTSRPNQSGSFLKRSHLLLDGVKECAAIRLVADQTQAIRWAVDSSKARDTVVIVTGQTNLTAKMSLDSLNSIQSLIDSMRQPLEESNEMDSLDELGKKISLKLFPG